MSSQVYYVGHSQGTTTLLVLLSERPEYNDKIKVASLMAPVGAIKHLDNSTKAAAEVAYTFVLVSKSYWREYYYCLK